MVKLLKDIKKGQVVVKKHPRAVAFVEFKDHEHALVALRVLNNNPETFGPENRPIVEFAVENIHKIKHRKAKLESSNENHGNVEGIIGQLKSSSPRTAGTVSSQNHKKKMRSTKHKKGHNKSSKESKPTEGTVKSIGEIKEGSIVVSSSKASKQERSVARKMSDFPAKMKHGKSINRDSHQEGTGTGKQQETAEKLVQKGASSQPGELKPKKGPRSTSCKRKLQADGEEHQKARKNPKRRKKAAAGLEEEDKLDMLIEKYRSKFSQRSLDKSKDATSSGHKEVRRWFES